jgi:hypothetical protein
MGEYENEPACLLLTRDSVMSKLCLKCCIHKRTIEEFSGIYYRPLKVNRSFGGLPGVISQKTELYLRSENLNNCSEKAGLQSTILQLSYCQLTVARMTMTISRAYTSKQLCWNKFVLCMTSDIIIGFNRNNFTFVGWFSTEYMTL